MHFFYQCLDSNWFQLLPLVHVGLLILYWGQCFEVFWTAFPINYAAWKPKMEEDENNGLLFSTGCLMECFGFCLFCPSQDNGLLALLEKGLIYPKLADLMDFTLKVTISQGQRSLDVPFKGNSFHPGRERNQLLLIVRGGRGSNEMKQTDLSTWLHLSAPSFQSSKRAGGEVLVAPTLREKPKLKGLPTNFWWEKIRTVVAFGVSCW